MKETPYELLKDNEKKQLGKNEEAKMTIYNALPQKEYERVFMCKTAKEFGKHSSSLTKAIYKSRIARLIFSLKNMRRLEEEALVEFMVELLEEDEDGKKNEKDGLFNLKANDQSRKA
ncbi:hypothetical protein Tco_0564427 [Tanacetum coccineum]